MFKWAKRVIEWLGLADTVGALLQAEFIRNLLVPTVLAVSAAIAGVLGSVPAMWIIMAGTITFMAAAQGMLRASEYLERKDPRNKIVWKGTRVGVDLEPTNAPLLGNRKQRRAQGAQAAPIVLGANRMQVGVPRNIDKAQVGVEVTNTATFPISVILIRAETELGGEKPPRGTYPRKPSTIHPGGSARIVDDPIDMDGMRCQRLEGKMDFKIWFMPRTRHLHRSR